MSDTRISIGVLLPNHRFTSYTGTDGVPDGFAQVGSKVTCTHAYDYRGFGCVTMTVKAAQTITDGDDTDYIMCRTPAIGFDHNKRFELNTVVQANDTSTEYGVQVYGRTSGDLIIDSSGTLAAGDTEYLLTRTSTSGEGTSGDDYYEVRLYLNDGGATDYVKYSTFLTLGYTFETNAAYYTLDGGVKPRDSEFYIDDFTSITRDAAGTSWQSNGTAGIDKHGLQLSMTNLSETDMERLRKIWRYTRGNPGTFSAGRGVIINLTGLPEISGNDMPHVNYNPGFYRWVDQRLPFTRTRQTWFPTSPVFEGVMTLEEP